MRWGEIIRRLVLVPPTLFGVAAIVFVLLRVVPGDPIAMMIPPGASTEDIVRLRALYGEEQQMQLSTAEGGGVEVSLRIPLTFGGEPEQTPALIEPTVALPHRVS